MWVLGCVVVGVGRLLLGLYSCLCFAVIRFVF